MCRICHEDGSHEKLVSPCHCTGTMGMLHVSCLERWLGSSNTTKCEICQFQFVVQKKPRPLIWVGNLWVQNFESTPPTLSSICRAQDK